MSGFHGTQEVPKSAESLCEWNVRVDSKDSVTVRLRPGQRWETNTQLQKSETSIHSMNLYKLPAMSQTLGQKSKELIMG